MMTSLSCSDVTEATDLPSWCDVAVIFCESEAESSDRVKSDAGAVKGKRKHFEMSGRSCCTVLCNMSAIEAAV